MRKRIKKRVALYKDKEVLIKGDTKLEKKRQERKRRKTRRERGRRRKRKRKRSKVKGEF